MAEPKRLRMGTEGPSPSIHEEESRVATLQATIEHYLPEFAAAVRKAVDEGEGNEARLVLHQDAFAAGYGDDEYMLLGMAVKYAGLKGVVLNIIGRNHETFSR
jgi:hypothetical protein